MINDIIKDLQTKISNLEDKFNKLENKSSNILNDTGFSVWTKKLLNLNIINKKRIQIKTIENKTKNHLFFQVNIKFLNYSTQEIKFELFCDNILIGSDIQSFQNGSSEISISGTYQNLISDNIKVELSINPKNNKQVTIIETNLTVWGITQFYNEEYEAIETDNEYFLSYISNNRLYYKKFEKKQSEIDSEFNFLDTANAHSICKDNNNQIYLFRVDTDGNLFFRNFIDAHEIFISNNVSKITSCVFNDSICYAYISNNNCYYGEILDNVVISNKKIISLFGKFSDCYLYTNNLINKCYMILTKEDESNYLLENIPSSFCSSENICAEINLNISTSEGDK